MNKYYSYPDIDIWDNNRWQGRLGCADVLVQWIESNGKAYVYYYGNNG